MWTDISYLLHSTTAKKILSLLRKPKTPSDIMKILGNEDIQGTSQTMQKLKTRKLIKCLNPRSFSYRLYIITPNGKKTLKQLLKLEEDNQEDNYDA